MTKPELAILLATMAGILVVSGSIHLGMAQTKPTVPEFTLKFVDASYEVPTTHSTDPYTGEDVIRPGYHVENRTIEIRIKNQAFTPYWIQEDENNWTINSFYNIRVKGHFAQNWSDLYGGSDGYLLQDYGSEYTVVPYKLEARSDGQIDFQVEALIGYEHGVYTYPPWSEWVITGEESGWSNTQTATISASPTPSPSLNPSISPSTFPTQQPTLEPSPTSNNIQAENYTPTIIIISIIAGAVIVALIAYFAKHKGWK